MKEKRLFLTSLKQTCNEYLIKFSENQSAPKLENRKTSPCSPCAPNLLHVLVSRILGYHNLCSPVVDVWEWVNFQIYFPKNICGVFCEHSSKYLAEEVWKKLFTTRQTLLLLLLKTILLKFYASLFHSVMETGYSIFIYKVTSNNATLVKNPLCY